MARQPFGPAASLGDFRSGVDTEVARQAFRLLAELVERGFALILDRGGMRRVWLRGRENVHRRCLVHVAGYNLGLIIWLLTGAGTPREFRSPVIALLFAIAAPEGGLIVVILIAGGDRVRALVVRVRPDPRG